MKELWNKNKYRLIALGIILGLWWAASRIYPPLIVPGIGKVFECIGRILIDRKMLVELLRTAPDVVAEPDSDEGLYTVKTPVEGFTGVGAGGVIFTNGVARVPEGFILDWFRDHGYTVTKE